MQDGHHAPLRVLFVCTRNSARSQIAEALLRHLCRGRAEVFSAGSKPAETIHPLVAEIVGEVIHADVTGAHPKPSSEFEGEPLDYVITLCDAAADQCPTFPGDPARIHWGFPDPAALGTPEEQRKAFRKTTTEILGRLRLWISLPQVAKRL